jgi:hypothetical protein
MRKGIEQTKMTTSDHTKASADNSHAYTDESSNADSKGDTIEKPAAHTEVSTRT